jgi:hypothetical protein
VVVSGYVQKSVQNQDLDFTGKLMALLDRLTQSGGHADG